MTNISSNFIGAIVLLFFCFIGSIVARCFHMIRPYGTLKPGHQYRVKTRAGKILSVFVRNGEKNILVFRNPENNEIIITTADNIFEA